MSKEESLINLDNVDEDALYEQLLLQAGQAGLTGDPSKTVPPSTAVIPKPGFCLKTRTDKDDKVFINICQGENVPKPKSITDEELLKLCESDDSNGYKIPMSLGEPHAEVDNKGSGCTAYDVVINPELLAELRGNRQVLLGFFLTVVIEGLEYKYNITLDRNWKILKHRKFVGSLPEQNIRTQSKPLIMEMDGGNQSMGVRPKIVTEMEDSAPAEPERKGPVPPYTIIAEPPEGHPEFLVAEVHMPKVKSSATMTLDVGEDRLLVTTRSNIYHLDIFLPYDLIQEDCGAQFNRQSKILTVTMPVQPQS